MTFTAGDQRRVGTLRARPTGPWCQTEGCWYSQDCQGPENLLGSATTVENQNYGARINTNQGRWTRKADGCSYED